MVLETTSIGERIFYRNTKQISAKAVQKYIEKQEAYHKQDNCRISEF